jgi:hypothetical protein
MESSTMKKCILLVIAILGSCAIGAEPAKKFDYPAEKFSIEVPGDWKEIPKKALDDYLKALATVMPQAANQTYAHGYQLASQQEWLVHPYIIIQFNNKSGRIPENELAKIKNLKEGFDKGINEVQKGLSAVVSQAKVGEPVYDPDTKILWMNISMNVQGAGVVKGLSGMHLTEEGLLCVNCYALESQFDSYAPKFEATVKSVTMDPTLKYSPRVTDTMPTWLIGAIIGGVIGGLFSLKKKLA